MTHTWESAPGRDIYTARGLDGQEYTWDNDAWSPDAGPQVTWVNTSCDWGVTSDQTWNTADWVQTYPHIGWAGGYRLSQYRHILVQTAATGPGYAEQLRWETAFDIWLNNGQPGSNAGYEVMIWTDVANVAPGGDHVASPVINGVHYSLYQGEGGNGPASWLVRAYRHQSLVTDVKACIAAVVAHKGNYDGPADPTVDTIEFGWEVWGTGHQPVKFHCSHYSMSFT